MQIHDRFNDPHVSQHRRIDEQVSPAAGRRAAQEAPSALRTSVEGSVLHQLRGLPELRADLVARARSLLESGQYLTAEAARATAGALLSTG